MWAQPEAGAEVPLAQRPARLPCASRAPQIWLPGFGCLAPASWSAGPRGDTWPPETEVLTPEKRTFVVRPSVTAGALRPIQRQETPPAPGRSGAATIALPKGRGEEPALGGGRQAGGLPLPKPLAREVGGSRVRRALGPRGRGSTPSSGGRARGLGGWAQAAAASRRRPEPGARPERGAGCGAAPCPAPLARARCPPAMPGFDYKFLEKPKRRLLCPLCGKPMREPVQVSTCGHRFCDTCLQEFLRCGPGVESGERPWPWRGGTEHGEGPRREARRAFVCAAAL